MSKSDEQLEREDTKRARASAKKDMPVLRGSGAGHADWANADPARVFRIVCSVAAAGGAVRLGYTRDGGAYSVGIYLGDNSKTYYCNDKDGINETLDNLQEYFEK